MKLPALVLAFSFGLSGAAMAQSPGDTTRDAANRGQGITTPSTGGGQSGLVLPAIQDPRRGPTGSNLPDFMTREAPARSPSERAADAPAAPPAHWRGDTASWERHRVACARQFQSYDAVTDEYINTAGQRVRCNL